MAYMLIYGKAVEYGIKTLPLARKTAIEIIQDPHRNITRVGIFDDEGYLVGRVSETNSFPYLWEVPTQKVKYRKEWAIMPTYKFGGLMRGDGVINTRLPANQVWQGGFYW